MNRIQINRLFSSIGILGITLILSVLVSLSKPIELNAQNLTSTTARSKQIIHEFYRKVINGHDPGASFDQLISLDFKEYSPVNPAGTREGFRNFAKGAFFSFPDVHVDYEILSANGDMVTVFGHVTGTLENDFFGIPAKSQKAKWTELHVFRVKEDQIVEHWVEVNIMNLLGQLKKG